MAKSLTHSLRLRRATARPRNADWRKLPEFSDHEFVMALSDETSGLRAYIGIHNTNLGQALGGTRLQPYTSEELALRDALNLSKAMSYKCALANLPYGGGKAVIIANSNADRAAVLAAYARLVEKLGGLFRTGTDVGVTDSDVELMSQHTKYMLGVSPADRGDLTTAKSAARGVFCAMKAALRIRYGSPDFNGKSVAVKGVGKLGGELARLVHEAGGQITVSDINDEACRVLQDQLPGVEIANNNRIHTLPVDIFAPCALGNEFTAQTVDELRCLAIVGGANNQLANVEIGNLIHEKGILYAPDYIANAGGLIYVADELEPGGFSSQRVIERVGAIEQTMLEIFQQASQENLPTHLVADRLAEARMRGVANGA